MHIITKAMKFDDFALNLRNIERFVYLNPQAKVIPKPKYANALLMVGSVG